LKDKNTKKCKIDNDCTRFDGHFQLQGNLPITWIVSRLCNRELSWALFTCIRSVVREYYRSCWSMKLSHVRALSTTLSLHTEWKCTGVNCSWHGED